MSSPKHYCTICRKSITPENFINSGLCGTCNEFETKFMAPNKGNNTMQHPLLNPDSKHYLMFDNVEAITRLEQMFSKKELAIWAKITSFKYRLRIGKKDDVQKEVGKILTYEAYYKYLNAIK